MFGRAPRAALFKRAQGLVPPSEAEPFFRGWQPGFSTYWPNATRFAAETEIYEDPAGDKLAIFRRVPPADPRSNSWIDRGRTAAGVSELHSSAHGERFRTFILPDGTWVSGWGTVALRLSARFAETASAPPRVAPKPTALFVQEVTVEAGIGGLSSVLYASDRILGITVATFGAPPGGEVPTTVDIVYPSSDLARAAAADLARIRSVSKPGRGRGDLFF